MNRPPGAEGTPKEHLKKFSISAGANRGPGICNGLALN